VVALRNGQYNGSMLMMQRWLTGAAALVLMGNLQMPSELISINQSRKHSDVRCGGVTAQIHYHEVV
jgi:hypothetical protein